MNNVTLMGRVGQDPELIYSKSGVAVCRFSLATNRYASGEAITDWHNVVCFNKTAEVAGNYVKKGEQVCIEGCVTYDKYDANGQTKVKTKILANRLHLISGQKTSEHNNVGPQKQTPIPMNIDLNDIEDGLPF
jgi:single-strand DNA-binding protein